MWPPGLRYEERQSLFLYVEGERVMVWLVIFQSLKTGIGWKKLRYCVIDQSGIQRDWVTLAWTWISGNFRKKLCESGILSSSWGAPYMFFGKISYEWIIFIELRKVTPFRCYPNFNYHNISLSSKFRPANLWTISKSLKNKKTLTKLKVLHNQSKIVASEFQPIWDQILSD